MTLYVMAKGFSLLGLGLGLLATAQCVLSSSIPRPTVTRRDGFTVTEQELSAFEYYAQYAGATYCNYNATAGDLIECSEDVCPDVTAAGATVYTVVSATITDLDVIVSTDDTNQQIVVSYKGSVSVRNWITDFVFLQTPCLEISLTCLVHLGFKAAHDETFSGVLQALEETTAANPSYTIIFTGHSMGGAVATLSGAYARMEGYALDIYSYASPRVGNQAFVSFVTEQAGAEYRVTHNVDPVPRLPPIFLNYRHTSPEYWLSTGNVTTIDYTTSEIEVCDGYANIDCNGKWTSFEPNAHLYYFEKINACGPTGIPFKRDVAETNVTKDMATTPPKDVTDSQLDAQLKEFYDEDVNYVASMKI